MRTCEIRHYFAKTPRNLCPAGPSPATTFPGVGTRIHYIELGFRFPENMVPAAGLDDVGTDREVLDSYHYVSPRRQSQAMSRPVFRDLPKSPTRSGSK